MTFPLPRSTARITLRRLRASDLANFQSYRHDEELGRYQGWLPQSDSDALAFLDEMSTIELLQREVWTQIAIADATTDELIGDIGVHLSADGVQAEIGFTLAKERHGKGLAGEAVRECLSMLFGFTAVHRVLGIADNRNFASAKLLERVGMRLKSTDVAYYRGEECLESTYFVERDDLRPQ